ncbi:MAG: YceD family protein [Candidatus Binatia bacterium]
MKLLIEDITTSPTEIEFVEGAQEVNRLLAPGDEAEYRLTTPLQVQITHQRSGEDLLFSGALHGELVGRCARCLEEYPLTCAYGFSVVLTPQRIVGREIELSRADLSASFYSGETIDLSALIQEQLLLALPSQPLCHEDCRGLCAQCGANLNVDPCECQPTWKDPRLDILSTLRLAPSRKD